MRASIRDLLKGSPTGLFIGLSLNDYFDLLNKYRAGEGINPYWATGNTSSISAGRISYIFGLQGPCLTVDTACSSSLVAINAAWKSLQTGESNLAVVGGINVMLNPDITIYFCKGHMLAKDGHCKTFDARADGYIRGEGGGVMILKRLSDAIRDQDPILAVIRASEVNQDGASSGLLVPNGDAQSKLIRQALEHAELEPNDIDYIEAHGTGTSLGDPIEVGALSTVFRGRKERPLWIGSVKTNIGHLEAAAGMAGVIKVVLALQNEAMPPHLHFETLNPLIPLDSIPAQIPLSLLPWLRSDRPRIAGVSGFAFSGTNAHVILEEAPVIEKEPNVIDRPVHVLTLSAKNEPALCQLIKDYANYMQSHPDVEFKNIAFTANTGRAHFATRIAMRAQDSSEMQTKLLQGETLIRQALAKPPGIVFLLRVKKIQISNLTSSFTRRSRPLKKV